MSARILIPFAIPPVLGVIAAEASSTDPGLLAWIERMGGWGVTALIVWIIVTKQQQVLARVVEELTSVKLALNTLATKCCGGKSQEVDHGGGK